MLISFAISREKSVYKNYLFDNFNVPGFEIIIQVADSSLVVGFFQKVFDMYFSRFTFGIHITLKHK